MAAVLVALVPRPEQQQADRSGDDNCRGRVTLKRRSRTDAVTGHVKQRTDLHNPSTSSWGTRFEQPDRIGGAR
jgi:hypothetical protein